MKRSTMQNIAHIGANALPIYRAYRGFATRAILANEYEDPRNRDWRFAGRTALDAVTDSLDGTMARYAGTTSIGGWIDQLADKVWFIPIAKQLADNQEISSVHYKTTLARDIGTSVIRAVAQHHDISVDARPSGKIKTHIQVAATVAACSPLAEKYPKLVNGLFSAATVMSIYSGAEMAFDYSKEIINKRNPED
jgi:phosphatidylglycerophosphate synthase